MKKIVVALFTISLIISTACKTGNKEEGPSQMEQVIQIHDEVMPKMGTIGKLVGQLKPMADSLGVDSPEAIAMKDLQDANKSMMDWMQSFGNNFNSEEILNGKALTEEKIQILHKEEEKIKALQKEVNSSIKKAQSILKAN